MSSLSFSVAGCEVDRVGNGSVSSFGGRLCRLDVANVVLPAHGPSQWVGRRLESSLFSVTLHLQQKAKHDVISRTKYGNYLQTKRILKISSVL